MTSAASVAVKKSIISKSSFNIKIRCNNLADYTTFLVVNSKYLLTGEKVFWYVSRSLFYIKKEFMTEEKNQVGRPTDYSIELAKEICEAIRSSSRGLDRLCDENPHWPVSRTIWRWMDEKEEFNQIYAYAKARQADVLAEEMIGIADDGSRDYVKDSEGKIVADYDHIQRARLRVDTRKFLMVKLAPRKYGDALQVGSMADDSKKTLEEINKQRGIDDGAKDKIEGELADFIG